MPAITAALSAICGTHFGLTKLVTSISRRPAACRRCTSSILAAAATGCFSFCSPSRGPTSTSVTLAGSCHCRRPPGAAVRRPRSPGRPPRRAARRRCRRAARGSCAPSSSPPSPPAAGRACTLSPALARKAITLPGIGAVRRPPSAGAVAGMRDAGRSRAISALPSGANTATCSPIGIHRQRAAAARPASTSWRSPPSACAAQRPARRSPSVEPQRAVVQRAAASPRGARRRHRGRSAASRRRAGASRRAATTGRRPRSAASCASACATTPAAAQSQRQRRLRRTAPRARARSARCRGRPCANGARLCTTRRRKATLVCRPTMCVCASAASSRASACARSCAPDDQLGDHRVVVRADRVALAEAASMRTARS